MIDDGQKRLKVIGEINVCLANLQTAEERERAAEATLDTICERKLEARVAYTRLYDDLLATLGAPGASAAERTEIGNAINGCLDQLSEDAPATQKARSERGTAEALARKLREELAALDLRLRKLLPEEHLVREVSVPIESAAPVPEPSMDDIGFLEWKRRARARADGAGA